MEETPDENKHQEEELLDDEDSDVSGGEEDEEEGESDGSESEQSEAGEGGASGISSDESDGGSDKCAICLQKFHGQELGLPETCEHYFCLRCLTEWSKKVTTCPVDRKVFSSILVKGDVSGPVLRVVDVEVSNVDNPTLFDEYYDTDPTYCEICGHCDREDRLLLCDNCDLGFHLECLEPPLEYVPIEDWYCPTCEAQRTAATNEPSVSQPRATRRQLRLPRTGQSRRLIESIRQATQQATPVTSSRTTVPRSQGTRSSGGKTKKKTYRRRSAKRAGGGRKRKRKTRKGKKRSRVATDRRPATTKGRLAVHLGIVPPRPGQVYVGLPSCRSAGTRAGGEANCSALRSLRHQAGITPLRIFSTSDDLADYMEVDSDEDGEVGVARPRAVHHHGPIKRALQPTSSLHQNSPDILGPILNNQMIMLTDRNIHVKRDGTLIPSLGHQLRNFNSNNSAANGSRSRPNGIGGSPDSGSRRTPGSPSSNDANTHGTPGFTNNNDVSNRDANSYSKESSSTSRRDSGSSWSSPSAGNDPSGARAYEQFLQASAPPDESPSKTKPAESQSKKNVDEDDGTYSDIEADDTSQDMDKSTKVSSNTEQDQKNGPDGSDNELVIDEEGRSVISIAPTYPPSSLPIAEVGVAETAKISLDDVPSPDSIPLPDSTPPPSAIHDDGSDSDEEGASDNVKFPKGNQTREEYDPSQPLTSSDEEEHSTKLSINRKKQKKAPASSTSTRRSSVDELEEIDLSSIPMPSDDYKKPVPEKIQFSIPTRHKLVSISSLIKRQRGVTKKESRASNNFSLEISKAFGEEKQDSEEESEETPDAAPKLSLVAEIFGSDEEEVPDTQQDHSTGEVTEDKAPEPEMEMDQASSEQLPSIALEAAGTDSSRWKTVEESTEIVPQVSVPHVAATDNADSDSDDSIAVVDTVRRNPTEDDDIQFISISKSTTKVASNNQGMPKPKSVAKSRTSVLESISDGDSEFESKSEDSSKSSEEKESRVKRRKLSILSGNAEEGEIVDSPEKRRKRKKEKKKGKKRRKSKEDKTRFLFSEKRPNSNDPKTAGLNSSEEENQSENVSWKKPTHSAKERNYRDGKPKPEEKYFKTTPKKRETSPKRVEKPKEPSDRERTAKEKPRSTQKGRSRSRSKSVSKDRGAPRRISARPRRSVSSTRSRGSRSRSRSNRRSRRRRRLSTSPKRSRSRSRSRGSQTRRSRSPFRSRRRSSSFNSRRRKIRRRSNSSASSGSSHGRRQKGRIEVRDRKKKPKETEKTKENPTEVKDVKEKDKEREKDKKKKKRRKEKSISPAKAIFADGDSIVVSLNFQKNTTASVTKDGSPPKNESEGDRKRNKRVRHTRTASQTDGEGKPKFLKKTLLIDLETSPIQEQNIGLSPTLIVLSDDEDGEHKKGSKNEDVATSNGPADRTGRSESPFGKLPGINDGSLAQGQNESHDKLLNNGSVSPSENSNRTPVRLGNANTSREQDNGPLRSRTSRSLSHSPANDDNMDIEPHSPAGSPPPLPSSTPPPMHSMGGRGNEASINAAGSQSSSSGLFQSKPVGGNLTNFFGNSNVPVGGVPPPLMIPAPQVQQVRFPAGVNQNLFTTNLLASLYGPILAARQQQQGPGGNNSANLNSRNSNSNTNILLPKNQLAQSSHSRSKGTGQNATGDSPFSPNSSDGDDLFEPPTDRGNGDAPGRTEKPPPQSSSTSGPGTSGSSKPKGALFDSLFGSVGKKPTATVKSHGKQSKAKGGNQSKQKSKKHKKEVVKLTEGELRLTEDVPNSAVELRVKEKFLKKVNRQERVVEEVKLALKPHYSKKHVTKDEYKDILRRAVPKICHNKSGEINPSKIKELVEAYVKKIRHGRKKDA